MVHRESIVVSIPNASFLLRVGERLSKVEQDEVINLIRHGPMTQRIKYESGVFGDFTLGHAKWGRDGEQLNADAIVHAVWKGGSTYLIFDPGVGIPRPWSTPRPTI